VPSTAGPSAFAHAGKGLGHLVPGYTESSELTANILIADRNNNRLIAISPLGQVVHQIAQSAPGDASLSSSGHTVYVTEHLQSVVVDVALDDGKVVYHYGVHDHRGAGDDRLRDPETAQEQTATGNVVIADRNNCRLVFVNPNLPDLHKPIAVWGAHGDCRHQVSAQPLRFGYPVSAFADGDQIIVTESNPAWVDVINATTKALISATQLPYGQPSDASEYAPDRIIVTDRTHPGKIAEFDFGSSLSTLVATWTYDVTSGAGELDRPTQAIVLPGGDVLVADSGNDRVVVIDPATDKIIWQYGHTHVYGQAPGYLHTPDSVELVPRSLPPVVG
jgi:DNA-binding beta-propeller fold protein YncE